MFGSWSGGAGSGRVGAVLTKVMRARVTPERALGMFVFLLPGIWVLAVLILEAVLPSGVELAPLLAAAPAIACAGTGRRQCVVLAGLCALFALLPQPGEGAGVADGLGRRLGTFAAILAVVVASFAVSVRRRRMLARLSEVSAIADVAQRVLLRPPRSRVGDVWVAARYASAAAGAAIGGDFYDVVDTPYGVRAVIGDVRGNGLAAVECASVLLGSFREAAYDEPDLGDLAHRLDLTLRRYLGRTDPAPRTSAHSLWADTGTLTALAPPPTDTREEFASVALACVRPDGFLELVNCGHPDPYLVRAGEVTPLRADTAGLPLGLATLGPNGRLCPGTAVTRFDSGDSLLLYTDGVIGDVINGDLSEEPLPLPALLADVADAYPEHVVETIHREMTGRRRGRPADDQAILYLYQP